MRTKFKNVVNLLFIVLFASCSREGIVENDNLPEDGKIAVATEVIVDGVELATRAASEAGYTTGDGLYDKGDPVTVAAHANDGYELVRFYDKDGNVGQQDGSSYTFPARIPQTFKAEFRKKSFTITVNASPADGGTVTGGGSYDKGSSCTVTAVPNNGYTFDGWYEGSTKVSTSSSYNFTVSSNRTVTAKFRSNVPIIRDNYIRAIGLYATGIGGYFDIRISSDYALASDIIITYDCRGNYNYSEHTVEGSVTSGTRYWDVINKKFTLKKGESTWNISSGTAEGGWTTFDGWQEPGIDYIVRFDRFSDGEFNYFMLQDGGTEMP